MREVGTAESLDWRDEVFAALKQAEIRQVGYVPDAGHARLIELCRDDPEIRAVPLTSEEEGVALLAGAWLGGQRGALLMQSSGVGNCINMLAMTKTCRFPLTMLVTMRGEWAEFNPWQVPMGGRRRKPPSSSAMCSSIASTTRKTPARPSPPRSTLPLMAISRPQCCCRNA